MIYSTGTCLLLVLSITTIGVCSGQLVVNVKNNGGDVYREHIEANTTQDSIILGFRKADGTVITQFIDGRNEIQIFRVVILPEEELGQTQIQTMCFVLRFNKNEFISSDAMSKLRQKNPSTVRHPEEVRPMETFEFDRLLNVGTSHVISAHISELCRNASTMTYTRNSDLRMLSQILNRDYEILRSVSQPAPVANLLMCSDTLYDSSSSLPCLCHYDVCVGWYPCGLKYCRGKDSAGRIVSYRCGIKTCSRCERLEFRVESKSFCVWDEPEFQLANWQPDLDPAAAAGIVDEVADTAVNVSVAPHAPAFKPNGEVNQPTDGSSTKPQNGDGSLRVVRKKQKMEQVGVVGNQPIVLPNNLKNHAKSANSPAQNALDDDDEDGE